MRKIISTIKSTLQKEFVKGFLILFSGSSIAQAIPLLATIVLARIFSNDSFGILFLYSTTVTLLSILATLKYELAIVLPKNEIEAINLLILSLLVCTLISSFLFLCALTFSESITEMFKNDGIRRWLYFVPLSVFFSGIFQATNNWFLWQKKFKKISLANITKSTGTASTQLAMGLSKVTQWGLVPGLIVGQFLSAGINIYFTYTDIKLNLKYVSWKRIKLLAYRHRNLPQFSTLLGFSNTLSNQLPILFLTKYFGLTVTSYYGMAHRLVGTPMGLIGNSVSKVFFKKASDIYNSKSDLTKFLKNTYLNLFKVGIVPFSILFIATPFLIKITLGEDWNEVTKYLRILLPWLFLGFLNAPVSNIITLLRKQKQILIYDLLLLISRFLALFLGYHFFNDAIISIALFSIVGVLFNLILMTILIHFSKKSYISS